jgi:hypothetical protein
MIARLNAMYQGSKKLLIFLVVTLLASTIASGVMIVISNLGVSSRKFYRWKSGAQETHGHLPEEAVLSGYHTCTTKIDIHMMYLTYESVISTTVWEVLTLFLALWIVIKHFRELRQSPTGLTIGDCLRVLIESHVFYFVAWVQWSGCLLSFTESTLASFATMTCFTLGSVSPGITVRWPVTSICRWPLSHHFPAEFDICGSWCLLWCLGNCPDVADVCAGTASDSQRSKISC